MDMSLIQIKSMSLMIDDIYNQTKKNILDLDIKTKEDLQNYNNVLYLVFF